MSRLTRNGVSLAYEEAGAGEPPILLVHSWTGDRSYFAPQVSHFSGAHRVLAVDLRGHGESDKPHGEYSPDVFAEDVGWMCDQIGLRNSVLVGHSMGGNIVLELAARRPDLAAAVILLDAAVFPPRSLVASMTAAAREFRGPNYAEAARQFVDAFFLPTDEPARRAEILDKTAGCPQHVLSSAWEQSVVSYDASAAATACRVPICYIGAATPLADLSRLRTLCPQLVIGQTVGAGHFQGLEVPAQINAMIERFLLTSLPGTCKTR
jgi:pimeloyl-ACP methyl ester carboxylesterase